MKKKVSLDPYFIPNIKINLQWIIDLNLRDKTLKFLEENIGINAFYSGVGKGHKKHMPQK